MNWLVPIVTVFAATVAFLQWWAARQKLCIDLFKDRYQIYKDLTDYAMTARETKTADLREFAEILARARFLFGDDILSGLGTMHNFICGIKSSGFPNAAEQIYDAFRDMEPLFGRYMMLPYRLPGSVFEFPRRRVQTGYLRRVKNH